MSSLSETDHSKHDHLQRTAENTRDEVKLVIFFYLESIPFPNKSWLLHVCSKNYFKTLWDKRNC